VIIMGLLGKKATISDVRYRSGKEVVRIELDKSDFWELFEQGIIDR